VKQYVRCAQLFLPCEFASRELAGEVLQ